MDWSLAIERNRQPLFGIVAVLFDMIGLGDSGTVERVARPLYRAVLAVLRPAEAAVRRLIVVAARGIVVKPQKARPASAKRIVSSGTGGQGRVSFQLCDPRRVIAPAYRRRGAAHKVGPRAHVIDVTFDPRTPLFRRSHQPAPAAPAREADDTVNAAPLCRRLSAIRLALQDLPRQARRYARWQARPVETRRPQREAALRTGLPPGLRKRPTHEVEDILAECHWLARHAVAADTS